MTHTQHWNMGCEVCRPSSRCNWKERFFARPGMKAWFLQVFHQFSNKTRRGYFTFFKTTCNLQLTTYYLPSNTYYLLPTNRYSPPNTYHELPTTYHELPTTYYLGTNTQTSFVSVSGGLVGSRDLCREAWRLYSCTRDAQQHTVFLCIH